MSAPSGHSDSQNKKCHKIKTYALFFYSLVVGVVVEREACKGDALPAMGALVEGEASEDVSVAPPAVGVVVEGEASGDVSVAPHAVVEGEASEDVSVAPPAVGVVVEGEQVEMSQLLRMQ